MTLAAFLKQHGLTNAQFAKLIGVSEEAVRLYRAALRVPTPHTRRIGGKPVTIDVARKINKATGGAVTRAEMHASYVERKQRDGQLGTVHDGIKTRARGD